MKKIWLPIVLCLLLGGCASPPRDAAPVVETASPEKTAAADAPVYAIVVKDTTNPYMECMAEGFAEGCAELRARVRFSGPGADGTPTQAETLEALLQEGVDAIIIAANDRDEVSSALQRAIAAGIPVVSLDSMVNPEERLVHIQQASPEAVGRVLIQAGAQMLGQEGEIAILTTTATTPNQASWVRWMTHELESQPQRYAGIDLVATVYGLDESAASAEQTRLLLAGYPDLRLIISPTVVGLRAAAEVLTEAESPVKVTGLGLPSEMEPYVLSGVCPWMYLWNPSEVGYLAAYATDALVKGAMTGAPGEILSAGTLGDKVVTVSEDGGNEIVLGHPKMFDATNITMWKEVF